MITTLLAARPGPTTADWLTAWTTLDAFFAAGVAAFAAWRGLMATRQGLDDERDARQQAVTRLNAEVADREAERRDGEARQARLVSADPGEERGLGVLGDMSDPAYQVDFTVHNDSTEPIRDVTGTGFRYAPAARPETAEPVPATVHPIRRIPPGGSENLKFEPLDGEQYVFPARTSWQEPLRATNWTSSSPMPLACAGDGAVPRSRSGFSSTPPRTSR